MDFLAVLRNMVHIPKGRLVDARDVGKDLMLAPLIKQLLFGLEADSWQFLPRTTSWAKFPEVISNLTNLMSVTH
jgi:hypothetical protein